MTAIGATMSDQIEKNPNIGDWQAASLRLTAFPGISGNVPAETWFEEIIGHPPDQITRQRSGHVEVVGMVNSLNLTLSIDAVKIEWRMAPAGDASALTDDIPNLGAFFQVVDSFLHLMSSWLDRTRLEVNRLAFGAELLVPVEGRSDGYRYLSTYLPSVIVDPDGSSDLLYQINRFRPSRIGIADLIINRLTKWSVAKLAQVAVLPNGQLVPLSDTTRYFCCLELDINTSEDRTEMLPDDQLAAIFQELIDFGREIAVEGDIP